jgi:ABC-type polysaccharide/polyol phosphate transport system ATPase subunit
MMRIKVEGVTLDIPIVDGRRSLRGELLASYTGGRIRGGNKQDPRVSVRALDGVSFCLREGDRLGLIGHNGSGKTTLLRLLCGIYEPTQGSVWTQGKVTPLFNPMIGLDQDDTGYENIFNIGFLLGMSRADVRGKIDEIAAFCELGEFLDLPVRTYSSGMLVRLAFAVATSIDTDILLLDEAIGAGDARFATRAERRVNAFYQRIGALVIASHSTELIRKMCNSALLLEHGTAIAYGDVSEVLELYESRVREQQRLAAEDAAPESAHA